MQPAKYQIGNKIHIIKNDITLCGLEINENWFVLSNKFLNKINCQKCLKEINKEKKKK